MGNCNNSNPENEITMHQDHINADITMKKAKAKAAVIPGKDNMLVNDFEIVVEEEYRDRKEYKLETLKTQIQQKGYISDKQTMLAQTPEVILQLEEKSKLNDLTEEWAKDEVNKDLLYPGVVQFFDGSFYDGLWNSDFKKHGLGSLLMHNGTKYVGIFKDDKIEGKGYYIEQDGKLYIGDFVNNMAHGKGKILCDKDLGYSYEGDFDSNLFHGEGKETYSNGNIFQGKFTHGMKGPVGKISFADGSSYEGEIDNGILQGKGTFKWKDGRVYTGEFTNNKVYGRGKTTWVDGSYYEGEHKNDKFNGIGELRQSDGSIFKGNWINNFIHGVGYYKDDTQEFKGLWRFNRNIMKF